MLARGVLSDFARGHGGAVFDPKRDLVKTILDHVSERDAERVVILDPSSPGPLPGIDLLHTGDPDLRTDMVIGVVRALFPDHGGLRVEQWLRTGVRTLSDQPGAVLTDLGRLFTEPAFRRAAVVRVADPMVRASWQHFEALSPGEQATQVAAPLDRVMTLLSRPSVRAVLAQPEPKLQIERLLRERRLLLFAASPGTLGEPASRLLGACILYSVWAAIEARAALPPEKRHPVFLTVDEFAAVADLPIGFELLAERARGLGAGLTLATQSLGRLPESLRSAVLANAATLVSFRAGSDEAQRLARELPGLTASDLQALGAFEVAARIGTGAGSAVQVVTGRTEPLPPPLGNAQRIRERSAERYGVPREEIERALLQRYESAEADPNVGQIGRKRGRS